MGTLHSGPSLTVSGQWPGQWSARLSWRGPDCRQAWTPPSPGAQREHRGCSSGCMKVSGWDLLTEDAGDECRGQGASQGSSPCRGQRQARARPALLQRLSAHSCCVPPTTGVLPTLRTPPCLSAPAFLPSPRLTQGPHSCLHSRDRSLRLLGYGWEGTASPGLRDQKRQSPSHWATAGSLS